MNTINIAQIATRADTQFRAKCEEGSKEHGRREANIEDMMDLISRGVTFKTPIRIASWNDMLYLVDGFHRVSAYERLKIMEIPAEQFVVVEAASIEEVRALAAGANVQHGKGNTNADYHNIIKRLMDLGDTYMANCFEPDIKKIAESIGAAQTAVGRGYNNYKGTEKQPVPSLSSICKEKRDAAINEQHKAGMSDYAIAKLFGMNAMTVGRILGADADSNKIPNRENVTTQAPATLTQANTIDRYDTRIDANSHLSNLLADILSEDDDGDSLTEDEADDEQEDRAPFDVFAVTGFGHDIATHAKPVKKDAMTLAIDALKALTRDEAIAAAYSAHGITLS